MASRSTRSIGRPIRRSTRAQCGRGPAHAACEHKMGGGKKIECEEEEEEEAGGGASDEVARTEG